MRDNNVKILIKELQVLYSRCQTRGTVQKIDRILNKIFETCSEFDIVLEKEFIPNMGKNVEIIKITDCEDKKENVSNDWMKMFVCIFIFCLALLPYPFNWNLLNSMYMLINKYFMYYMGVIFCN